MTISMRCLKCGGMVINPRIINMMTERCTPCEKGYEQMAELAIGNYYGSDSKETE